MPLFNTTFVIFNFTHSFLFFVIKLEIKDITDTARSAPYLDLHLEIDSKRRFRTKLYDKGNGLNIPIVNVPFTCSNIQAALVYGVYISAFMQYFRTCGSYHDYLDRGLLLTKMDYPEKLATYIGYTRRIQAKQKRNTTCVGRQTRIT